MPANIPEIIRAATTKGSGPGILEFLDIYFIIRRVAIILYTEHGRAEQVIIFHKLNKADSVDLLPSADHFIRSMGIYVFDQVG